VPEARFLANFRGRIVFCYFATRQSRKKTRGSDKPAAGDIEFYNNLD
jgi:hypothetical protein